MGVIGKKRDFYDKFKYFVEIDGVRYAGFSKCSELAVEIEKIEHHEGGGMLPHKRAGKVSFPDLNLERGATDDLDMYDWLEDVVDVASGISGRGLTGDQYKRDFDIVCLNRDDSVRQRLQCFGGFPIKYVAGDWDSSSSEAQIEKTTITIDYWVPKIRKR